MLGDTAQVRDETDEFLITLDTLFNKLHLRVQYTYLFILFVARRTPCQSGAQGTTGLGRTAGGIRSSEDLMALETDYLSYSVKIIQQNMTETKHDRN